MRISCVPFSPGSVETHVGIRKNLNSHLMPVVSAIFVPKIIKICYFFFKLQPKMTEILFLDTVYIIILNELEKYVGTKQKLCGHQPKCTLH